MMTAPLMNFLIMRVDIEEREAGGENAPKITVPITVPVRRPTPPDSEAPPITAARSASSSKPTPDARLSADRARGLHDAGQTGKQAGERVTTMM